MKQLFGILMLCSINSYAADGRHITLSASSPMPANYSASNAQSLIVSEMYSLRHLAIVNYTQASLVCLNVDGPYSVNTPPQLRNGIEGKELILAASEHMLLHDYFPSPNLYCRGENGAVPAGDVFVNAW